MTTSCAPKTLPLIEEAETTLASYWQTIESRCHTNTERVLRAFLNHGLDEMHFSSVTGYAHHDLGRHALDNIMAELAGAEAALVRVQFVSGTHAIGCALKGVLKPSDLLLAITGAPYDTLEGVIGKVRPGQTPSRQSLQAQGVRYAEMDIFADVPPSQRVRWTWTEEETALIQQANALFIQRSRGYSLRPTLSGEELKRLIAQIKQVNPEVVVVVDNCYGEFIDTEEPTQYGADLIAGSLIKNPGGGLAVAGGYIAGKSCYVEQAAEELTVPGVGSEGGYMFDLTRTLVQGLYFAPTVVKEALKSMSLFAAVFEQLGYTVYPTSQGPFNDIIQVIELGDPDKVLQFCKTLQQCSPVGAKLTPIPAVTPGYADPVVMAGGTFIFGSTIELSADAPMRPPYAVYIQGGLVYSHARFALSQILDTLLA